MDAGLLDRDECRFHAEHVPNAFGCQHLDGRASCDDTAMVQQHDLVSKSGREIQIMHHADRDYIRRVGKAAHLFHECDLVMNVEKSERLVQE